MADYQQLPVGAEDCESRARHDSSGPASPIVTPSAQSVPEGTNTERDELGRFRPGNQAAVLHGAYRAALRDGGLPAELLDEMAGFRTSVVADLGGETELSAIAFGYVRRLVELETFARLFVADLEGRGLFTKRGRVRSSYGQLMATVDRWDRIATKLGLERRAKQLPHPADWLEGKA